MYHAPQIVWSSNVYDSDEVDGTCLKGEGSVSVTCATSMINCEEIVKISSIEYFIKPYGYESTDVKT